MLSTFLFINVLQIVILHEPQLPAPFQKQIHCLKYNTYFLDILSFIQSDKKVF